MTKDELDSLFDKIGPALTKQTTNMREPIRASNKLDITLRFLATGRTFRDLQTDFRVSYSSIAQFVPECCQLIYDALKADFMKVGLLDNMMFKNEKKCKKNTTDPQFSNNTLV